MWKPPCRTQDETRSMAVEPIFLQTVPIDWGLYQPYRIETHALSASDWGLYQIKLLKSAKKILRWVVGWSQKVMQVMQRSFWVKAWENKVKDWIFQARDVAGPSLLDLWLSKTSGWDFRWIPDELDIKSCRHSKRPYDTSYFQMCESSWFSQR